MSFFTYESKLGGGVFCNKFSVKLSFSLPNYCSDFLGFGKVHLAAIIGLLTGHCLIGIHAVKLKKASRAQTDKVVRKKKI